MKGLKKKPRTGGVVVEKAVLTKNLKAKMPKMKLSSNVKEKIKDNPMEVSCEWSVPKKTAKNWISKPKKVNEEPSAEILAGSGPSGCCQPRLYVRFPKSLESMKLDRGQLIKMHPDIIDVRIPRKKLHSKWCLAVFDSEEKALAAKGDIMTKGACTVTAQFSKVEHEKRKKTIKSDRQSLIRSWTLDTMDVADDDTSD